MKISNIDIYNQKNLLQIFIGLNLALIGIASLFYTYNIVENIDKREQQQLRLLAGLLQYSANHDAENAEDLTPLLEIVQQNIVQSRIPYLIVSEDKVPIEGINIDIPPNVSLKEKQQYLNAFFNKIKDDQPPIFIDISGIKQYIYYGDSPMLTQMRYYPYVQLLSLLVLGILAYLVFSSSRTAEQNRVWVGLAKETAHQLGTPIASMMGWVELFRSMPEQYSEEVTEEIEKDVKRLETITTRFSNIGSVPSMKDEDLADLVGPFLIYLQRRISTKVKITFENELPIHRKLLINRSLFEWVIENLCKNAVDAMNGIGAIHVRMAETKTDIVIDISDTGKGIPKSDWKKVFNAGVSTKKRGWGLGLTLAKRIIEEYHGGKLFIKHSEINKGTTFRIVLKK